MASAATRLRSTFKYPSEDELSTSERDEMDEEEQEELISSLSTQSQTSNRQYILAFTCFPLVVTPLFLWQIFLAPTYASVPAARVRLLSLLALTSLAASAFGMYFLTSEVETAKTAREGLLAKVGRRRQRPGTAHESRREGVWVQIRDVLGQAENRLDDVRLALDREGPLLRVLPWLNGLMCVLLAFAAWVVWRQGEAVFALYLLVPGTMLGMVTVARRAVIDEERAVQELGRLRYRYKGA